ncbi:MAG: DUF87 domain-containing protein [Caldilineaceae bacterium]|nr:DUF87 domain-containing protein [Caldilineaceae bacterium]
MQAPPEKLGSFYLGAEYDLDAGARTELPVNYDARDLTTHAVCVGMTGSGKTGLCVGLLEEAALDRVPAILIDPKGDITNLLLQFPELRPEDFAPWVNVDDARRKEQTVEEYAQNTAGSWQKGLADWGIDGERIRTLLETVDYTIFTPGSDAGVSINIMGSLAAPALDFDGNAELIRERISGTVAALLGLVGIKSDPIRGTEAILLSNIFEHYWRNGEDLDLPKLIMAIQEPPVRQIGVFDVDTFYPQKDRFGLAMAFNNLMASPTFKTWLEGEPLEINSLFFTAEGKPRHSVFYIAHLSDSERMFFVTLLLEALVTWMRAQSGTTSLRSLLYFDEIFGFFPPSAEPSSKRPLLTLLKQARAFGLGVILVTQNPVDIDYKGLTNAGTWFIGKLQAERDKERVLSGLKGAIAEAGKSEKTDFSTLISKLGSRVFLMHNVHADGPVVMHTRWAQSYLRGPLTRPQVRELMAPRLTAIAEAAATAAAPATPAAPAAEITSVPATEVAPAESETAASTAPIGYLDVQPALDPAVEQVFLPVDVDEDAAVNALREQGATIGKLVNVQLLYEPTVYAAASVNFFDRKRSVNQQTDRFMLASAPDRGGVDWERADALDLTVRELDDRPAAVDAGQGPYFAPVPEELNDARKLKAVAGDLSDWLYYNSTFALTVHTELDEYWHPGESERDFKARLQQAARERRDADVDKLSAKFERDIDKLRDKLAKAERSLAEDKAKWENRRLEEFVSAGESVMGYFLGRSSRRALSSAMTKRRMTSQAQMSIQESEAAIVKLKEDIAAMEEDLKAQTEEITVHYAQLMDELSTEELKPRRTDVNVQLVALAWAPYWQIRFDDGLRERDGSVPAYRVASAAA